LYYYYLFSNQAGSEGIEMAVGSITKFVFAVSAAFAVAVSNHAGFLAIVFMAVLTAFISWGGGIRDVLRIAGIAFWFFLLVFLLHLFSGSGRVLFNIWILKAYANGFESGLFYGMKLRKRPVLRDEIDHFCLFRLHYFLQSSSTRVNKTSGKNGPVPGACRADYLIFLAFVFPGPAFFARTLPSGSKNHDGLQVVKVANLLLVSIFVNTFEKAESVSIALNIRGYPLRYKRAVLPPPKISLFGIFVLIVSVSMVFAGWMSR
jgi:energy-coupling factor transporter transmembrane protein EcfT